MIPPRGRMIRELVLPEEVGRAEFNVATLTYGTVACTGIRIIV